MKDYYGNDIMYSVFSKSNEGEYIMVKNATKENTWWKKEEQIKKENLYSTKEAAKNAWMRRMQDYTFRELYAKDFTYICAVLFYPDGTKLGAVPASMYLRH